MNAVGIDVSKGKSTVTIRRPGNVVVMPPCDIPHTQSAINCLIEQLLSLDGETKVCMEHTGRYYEPVATWLSDAGLFVSAAVSYTHLDVYKRQLTYGLSDTLWTIPYILRNCSI